MTRFCSSCGAPVTETAKFCNECGARLTDRVFPGQVPPANDAGGEKSTFLAVAGSTFIPGLGQVYEGHILKGYLVFFGTFFGVFLLIIPGLIMWLYGIYDAYTTADRMNRGVIPFRAGAYAPHGDLCCRGDCRCHRRLHRDHVPRHVPWRATPQQRRLRTIPVNEHHGYQHPDQAGWRRINPGNPGPRGYRGMTTPPMPWIKPLVQAISGMVTGVPP